MVWIGVLLFCMVYLRMFFGFSTVYPFGLKPCFLQNRNQSGETNRLAFLTRSRGGLAGEVQMPFSAFTKDE